MNNDWTTTPPSQLGWYWARGIFRLTVDEWKESIELVRVDKDEYEDGFLVYSCGSEIDDKIESYTHWIGPLKTPESPTP
jgi:hypothetical protein